MKLALWALKQPSGVILEDMSGTMDWSNVLEVIRQASSGEERRVLLVLADASFHVKEVLGKTGAGELLGFVVYADDPDLSNRTEETCLLFLRREQVVRVMIRGFDPLEGQSLGF